MSHLVTWLKDNVRNAATKCGARGASVYVPTRWDDASPGILLHVGVGDPLPEMVDLIEAAAFSAQMAQDDGAAFGPHADLPFVPSACPHGCLIPIPMLAAHWQASASATGGDAAVNLGRRDSDRHAAPPIVGWLALRFADRGVSPAGSGDWRSLLAVAGALASTYVSFYGILTDPVTGLPGRAELSGTLRAELDHLATSGRPFSLLFVKLEQLDIVNQRLGRRGGDALLRGFLDIVQGVIRTSDVVMRYGGAVFALPLRGVNETGAMTLAAKILTRLSASSLYEGGPLPSAVGAVTCHPADAGALGPLDVLRRADQALSASRHGGGTQAVLWRADAQVAASAPTDPLLGVFTGQAEKDYRNMRLLWDVVQALSTSTGPDLAEAAIARIFSLFAATRTALFQPDAAGRLQLLTGRAQGGGDAAPRVLNALEVSEAEWQLNRRALETGVAQSSAWPSPEDARPAHAFAVPLVIDARAIGTLYLHSDDHTLKMDDNDVPVLSGVATHLALALDRDRLAIQQRARDQREQALLKSELNRLRSSVQSSPFVFQSPELTRLLDTTRRVAATDATVLITGESGTGKEMLAQTLHSLSTRHRKPLVIVDCGAIPASLIDSELFGRERGAYTGAERRAIGRLAQADGGTVFLDEIGELPLEVQAKLLRFVQEKTITMIGSTQMQQIDVRIVAATNRDLEGEVRAGRFREDLFHRLNVVRLRIPPLRERTGDVALLARHFLQSFAVQYGKPVQDFDADAERQLRVCPWPGNVRQLQNVILQAVVLSTGERITAADLGLPDSEPIASVAPTPPAAGRPRHLDDALSRPDATGQGLDDSMFAALQSALARLVSAGGASAVAVPLGCWLDEELMLRASRLAGGTLSRAAQLVSLPESTFARRLRTAQVGAASSHRPESWAEVQVALDDLLRRTPRLSGLAVAVNALLLETVVATGCSTAQAAALMGVSLPTMKRRLLERLALPKSA